MDPPLAEVDQELFDLIEKEKYRQWSTIELIPSENFTSRAVMDCLSSCLANQYTESISYRRYYGENRPDPVQNLCQSRALKAYRLDKNEWGCIVEPYSGSLANFQIFATLLKPHDKIMGLNITAGGHLSHGCIIPKKTNQKVVFYESVSYGLDPSTGTIDYDNLEKTARLLYPKIIIAGASAYPRDYDYSRFKAIAKEIGAIFMVDMAHYCGLVSSQLVNDPFPHADIVTTTTYKTMRGPRGALIFYRKSFEEKISTMISPSIQGGGHNNCIAGIATQLRELETNEYKEYSRKVIENCKIMGETLISLGYTLLSGGTDTHLLLWDLRPQGLTGNKMEKICEVAKIIVSKYAVPGDTSSLILGGIRIGSPAMTTRGATSEDFKRIAHFLHRALNIALEIQSDSNFGSYDFDDAIAQNPRIQQLKNHVHEFSIRFRMPGTDVSFMRPENFE